MDTRTGRTGSTQGERLGAMDVGAVASRGLAARTTGGYGIASVLTAMLLAASAAPVLADDGAKPAPAEGSKPATGDDKKPATDPKAAPAAKPAEPASPPPIQPAGSADDINDEIARMRPRPAGILPNGPVSILDQYFDKFNADMDKSFGLQFGMAYTYVFQRASDSDTGHKNAQGGDADIFARARFFGDEKSPNRGIIGVNGEYRHAYGDPTPKDLGEKFGSLWDTTNGFGRQDVELTQAWWEQHMAGDKIVMTVGKLDPDNYYNKNRYQNDNTAFMSQGFSSNPARKFPGNGLGFNALAQIAKDFYVTGGVQDANGAKDKSGFHTIDEGDMFGAGEVGWTPTFENQGQGAYRFTVWSTETATIAGFPDDHGMALSCEQPFYYGNFVPFFRAAWSEGDATGVERFANAGVGLEGVLVSKKDLTGIGVSWGDPKSNSDRDQYGGEIFHRFQLAPDVQLTLGYQYYIDPSFAPTSNHDPVGVIEIRVRIEF